MGRILERIFPLEPVSATIGVDVPPHAAWGAIRDEAARRAWDRSFLRYGEREGVLFMEKRTVTFRRVRFQLVEDSNPEGEEYRLGGEMERGPFWLREAREAWTVEAEGRFSRVSLDVFARISPFFVRRYAWAVVSAQAGRRLAAMKLWSERNLGAGEHGI